MAAAERGTIARVRAGDRDAYADLVRRYAGDAHRAAVFLGAGADAEDVVQAAFLKAYRALPTFRDGAAFRPWLLSIVANETKNAVRAMKRRRIDGEVTVDPAAATTDPQESVLSVERRVELLDAVRSLPDNQRRVVVCRYLLDLDEQETATVLGWPRGTVKSRLHRALRRLRSLLEDPAPAEG